MKALLPLITHGDAHGACGADLVAVDGHELGLTGDGGKRVVRDDVVHHAHSLDPYGPRPVGAEAGGTGSGQRGSGR